MIESIKEKVKVLLPELKEALENSEDFVTVGEIEISREEAEKIRKEFEFQLNSNDCKIGWDTIPLNLCSGNEEWRAIQESLNQM